LYEESYHNGGSDLKVEVGSDETVGVLAEEHVGYQIDEARGKKKGTTENIDVVHQFRRHMPTARNEKRPYNDAQNDEGVR
jgi:hypothetical protein